MWLSSFPAGGADEDKQAVMTQTQQRFAAAPGFEQVSETVLGRCSMCHAQEPSWDGIVRAPKGVVLETPEQIAAHAREIYLQAGHTNAMPPGNVSFMEDSERKAIIDWYQHAIAGTGQRS